MPGETVKTNAGNLAARMQKRAKAISDEAMKAERQNLEAAKGYAELLSSGGFHRTKSGDPPYSRQNPHPPAPPAIVNVQTGLLRRSWQTRLQQAAGKISGSLFNTAPYAGFFNGQPTARMIGRPILQETAKWLRGKRLQRMRGAVTKAMRQR